MQFSLHLTDVRPAQGTTLWKRHKFKVLKILLVTRMQLSCTEMFRHAHINEATQHAKMHLWKLIRKVHSSPLKHCFYILWIRTCLDYRWRWACGCSKKVYISTALLCETSFLSLRLYKIDQRILVPFLQLLQWTEKSLYLPSLQQYR